MLENGLNSYKDESTRDIICIDFSYKTRSYEQELQHLQSIRKKETDPEKIKKLDAVIEGVEKNKYLYREMSKDEIRLNFYQNGVPVIYRHKNNKTGEILEQKITYRMLYRNASKAKIGQAVFINEDLYEKADDWITMGLRKKLPHDEAKIVELAAYSPLVTSTIEDRFYMSLDEVLILDDEESVYHTIADVIKSKDYQTYERVVDNEATGREKAKAIENNILDIYGNPIYKTIYKVQECTKKRCVVEREEVDVVNNVWDGMALIESSFSPGESNGMVLLRNHFFKACAFKVHIQKFFRDYCEENNIDYDSFELVDIFGRKVLAKNIKLITNKDACKWWKFIDLMGNTKLEAYEYWRNRVEADGSIWGVVKQDHPSKLGDDHEIQQLSYQAINSLPCSKEDVEKIAQTSVSYVELLKNDNNEFKKFLRKNANEVNHYDMLADLYEWNSDFAQSKMWKQDKSEIINAYVNKLRKGKITVSGDNLVCCGNPYALLLYSVGENWESDPTLQPEDGVIQCYTRRFEDGECLCAIRSPHNSQANTGYFKNVRHPLMEKYMDFSKNIIAVNCIHTDVQSRLNGMDFDADSMLVTNQPEMVEAARISYRDYPTAVNAIGQSNKTYKNEMAEYAKMDSLANRAQMGIGLSSNLAQLGLSYYWTRKYYGIDDEETQELYHNCIILATLAQLLIDGIKRSFEVDALAEVERIQKSAVMNKTKIVIDASGKKKVERKDLPLFMKYIKEIPLTKNGQERNYSDVKKEKKKILDRIDNDILCPMNYLQEILNKIQGSNRNNIIDTEEFLMPIKGRADHRQVGRIRQIVENYDSWVRNNIYASEKNDNAEKDFWDEYIEKTNQVIEQIKGFKISKITLHRVIRVALGIDCRIKDEKRYKSSSKYTRKLLNIMYRVNKEEFLSNFVKSDY